MGVRGTRVWAQTALVQYRFGRPGAVVHPYVAGGLSYFDVDYVNFCTDRVYDLVNGQPVSRGPMRFDHRGTETGLAIAGEVTIALPARLVLKPELLFADTTAGSGGTGAGRGCRSERACGSEDEIESDSRADGNRERAPQHPRSVCRSFESSRTHGRSGQIAM